MTPTREERARVLAGVAWQSQTRPTLSDFDFFRDGFVDGYTWEDAEVERLREALRKIKQAAVSESSHLRGSSLCGVFRWIADTAWDALAALDKGGDHEQR